MPTFGLGNFLYDLETKDGKAVFNFYDPEDADNTAEVSLGEKDFDGFNPDSRQVADKAYAQVAKVLNDKRDARIAKQVKSDFEDKQAEDARVREARADFLNHSQDVQVAPAKVEDDGTHVYNTDGGDTSTGSTSDSSDKKSK